MDRYGQKNFDSNVETMVGLYRKMLTDKGDEYTRESLSAARESAVRIIYPVESAAALRLYQATEKAVFGNIGALNQGEKDLTENAVETEGR